MKTKKIEMIREQKLVSIGMPTFYRDYKGNYIKEALDSLINQSYSNIEIIISDNASPNRIEICEDYAKKYECVSYSRQKRNMGEMWNYNFVLDKAGGEYFMWACDDDVWDKEYIERCVKALESDSRAVVAFGKYVLFDDRIGIRKEIDPAKDFPGGSNPNLYERLKAYLLTYWIDSKGLLAFGLWRRSAILKNRKGNYWGSDMNFTFRGLIEGRFSYINKTMFFKRMNFNPVKAHSLLYRTLRTLGLRIKWLFSPLFYNFTIDILRARGASPLQKIKLLLWNFFVITRMFWNKKV